MRGMPIYFKLLIIIKQNAYVAPTELKFLALIECYRYVTPNGAQDGRKIMIISNMEKSHYLPLSILMSPGGTAYL